MSKLCLVVTAAGVALATWAASASVVSLPDPQDPELTPSERLEALVERVRRQQAKLETLEADFSQFKESSMLLEPVVSTGVFSYAAPDRVRWEFYSPNPISLLISGDEMITWYRDIGRAEKVHVGRHSQRIVQLLGAGSSVDQLLEHFTVTLRIPDDRAGPYRLELTPRYKRVSKRLRGMSLWIDPERYLLIRLRYLEPGGDVTEYRFDNLRINGDLPGDRFRLELPADVEVKFVELDRRTGLQ